MFADKISEDEVLLEQGDRCPYRRPPEDRDAHTHREGVHVKMEAEMRVTQRQATDPQLPLGAGGGREGPGLEPRRRLEARLPARAIHFCCSEPPACSNFSQRPRETNTPTSPRAARLRGHEAGGGTQAVLSTTAVITACGGCENQRRGLARASSPAPATAHARRKW